MLRRTLLQLPVVAAASSAVSTQSFAQSKQTSTGFKLSVRVEPLFRNMKLPEQMEKVAEAGYQGFEFGNWRGPG